MEFFFYFFLILLLIKPINIASFDKLININTDLLGWLKSVHIRDVHFLCHVLSSGGETKTYILLVEFCVVFADENVSEDP